ncbi:hypothetical protein V6N13_144318 [Hibiscus sabdariffa]
MAIWNVEQLLTKEVCDSVREQGGLRQCALDTLRRCSSPPSSVFSPPLSTLDQLQALFPHTDPQLLERVLLECGNDIKRLQELCMDAAEATGVEISSVEDLGISVSVQNPPVSENLPVDGQNGWACLRGRCIRSSCELER